MQYAHLLMIYRSDRRTNKQAKSLTSLTSITPLSEKCASGDESPLGFDVEPEEAGLPHFDRSVLVHLPGLLQDIVKTASNDREFDLMLLAGITILCTTVPGVSGMLKREPYRPPIYTLVIGPSGSGKGCINIVYRIVKAWQTYVSDISKARVKEYLAKKENCELYRAQQRSSRLLLAMGIIRELLGAGTVFGIPILSSFMEPIIIFLLPPGGFFVFGMLIALAGKLSKEGKAPESTGCAACPLAASCTKLQQKDNGKEAAH